MLKALEDEHTDLEPIKNSVVKPSGLISFDSVLSPEQNLLLSLFLSEVPKEKQGCILNLFRGYQSMARVYLGKVLKSKDPIMFNSLFTKFFAIYKELSMFAPGIFAKLLPKIEDKKTFSIVPHNSQKNRSC